MSRISIFMESCNGKFPNENSMLSVSFIKNMQKTKILLKTYLTMGKKEKTISK